MNFDIAKRKLMIADHMLIMTYKQLKDPKILVAVLDNLHSGISAALTVVLTKERDYKRIPAYPETIEGKMKVFREKLLAKTNLKDAQFKDMCEIVEMYREHKNSDIEFARKQQFVIAGKDYRLKTLSEDKLKKFISSAKITLQTLEAYHDRVIN